MLERLIFYGNKAPDATGEFAPHVIIRRIRKALYMTQAQLAKRSGMPQSHLAKIETGKVDVQLSTLRRILRAMYCEAVVLPKFYKSPQAALADRIREVARLHVARATGTVLSESRHAKDNTIRALIRAEEKRLMSRPTSKIWREAPNPGGTSIVRDQSEAKYARTQIPVRILEKEDEGDTLRFWLAQPPEARINAMEFLRRQCYLVTGQESLPRLVRSIQFREQRV